jgi:putative NADPH-quinone reductase
MAAAFGADRRRAAGDCLGAAPCYLLSAVARRHAGVAEGLFEQTLRPGFAIGKAAPGRLPKKLLAGRSARIVVTMGMPALFYKLYYRAHSLKSLKRNMLEFCGLSPVRATVIGMVEGRKDAREGWLTRLAVLGNEGS